MKQYRRILPFFLTAVLTAGLALPPVQVLAEETKKKPGEEKETSEEEFSEDGAEARKEDKNAGGEYDYYDEMDDMEVPVGRTCGIEPLIYAWREDPETGELDEKYLDVISAVSDDPSIAEAAAGDGVHGIEIEGKRTGTAGITVTYEDVDGGRRRTSFTVQVKEAVNSVSMYSSAAEDTYELEAGDKVDLWITADKDTGEEIVPYDDEDLTVVWTCTSLPEGEYDDCFSFSGEGSRAALSLGGEFPPYTSFSLEIEADVYLGSEVSEETYLGSAERDFYVSTDDEEPNARLDATETELMDDPASESLLTVTDEGNRGLKIRKWVAVEIPEDDGDGEEVPYPFAEGKDPLSTTVNGALLAELVGTDRTVEFYAVLCDEEGSEVFTDSVYITVYAEEEELTCEVGDLRMLPGEEFTTDSTASVYVRNMEYPDGTFMDADVRGAGAEDPSVAEVSYENGELTVTARNTGTTSAWLLCRDSKGNQTKCFFTVTVAEVRYNVYLEDSFSDYDMVMGDSAELSLEVTMETDSESREMEEDELDIRWEIEPLDEEEDTEDFSLEPDGKKARLSVIRESGSDYGKDVLVRARVYLKGTDTEIGSDSTEHRHKGVTDSFDYESSLEDPKLPVGESFTIRPFVLRRKELGNGTSSAEPEERAVYGLVFDPSQVRVTDQSGREVQPASLDEEEILIEGDGSGIVYTVTRLSEDEIEIDVAARWPGEDDEYPNSEKGFIYLDSLEDEPQDPGDPQEPEETGAPGQAAGRNTSGKNTDKSDSSKSSARSAATKKPVTGDDSSAAFWLLLAASSLTLCAGTALLKKKSS